MSIDIRRARTRMWTACGAVVWGLVLPVGAFAQATSTKAGGDELVRADAAFARAVATKDGQAFLSFLAEVITFNGGTPGEVHGREAVLQDWADFFAPDGPTLDWTPTKGEVIGAGDVGYTTGRAVFRRKGGDGGTLERHSAYLTVWRKQEDGRWKVVFDTGSTLPASSR